MKLESAPVDLYNNTISDFTASRLPPSAERPAYYSGTTIYLREIGAIPLVERKEERELLARAQGGNNQARDRMITGNLRLVVKIARSYEGRGLDLLDLVSAGNEGLTKAVDKFDLRRENKFSAYAGKLIKGSIMRTLSNQSRTIRLPVSAESSLHHLLKKNTELSCILGRPATEEELAEYCELPVAQVARILQSPRTISLDEAICGGGPDSARHEFIATPAKSSFGVDPDLLEQLMVKLSPREQTIIKKRYGNDRLSLEVIGQEQFCTRERVRQIEERALRKLRTQLAQMGIGREILQEN